MAFAFRTSAFVLVGAVLLGSPLGCGLVDQDGGAVPLGNRWLFLQGEDALTLVEFDDPRAPQLDERESVAGSFWWSPGAERVLVLGETAETNLLVEAPAWQPSPLPASELFHWVRFVGPDHFLGERSVGIDAQESVLRDVAGNALGRWGTDAIIHSTSRSGAFVALHDEDLTLVRRDLTTVVLTGPGLNWLHLVAYFDEAGESVLISTWAEDAVDFGPLPDFVAHIEMEAPPSCEDEWDCGRLIDPYPTQLASSGMIAATGLWRTSAGNAARLLSVPLGEKTVLPPPELTAPHLLADWEEGEGHVWVDGPTGRVRWVQADADAQTWTVDERDALDPSSDWQRIAEGPGSFLWYFPVDFNLLWLYDDSGVHALDLASERPPRFLGPNAPELQGWQRRTLFFEEDSPSLCERACRYVAYADPSDPEAPTLRGTLDPLHQDDYQVWDADFQWAPDHSGLLLRSDGWLYYHAFAAPNVRFRLAPLAEETLLRVPPAW